MFYSTLRPYSIVFPGRVSALWLAWYIDTYIFLSQPLHIFPCRWRSFWRINVDHVAPTPQTRYRVQYADFPGDGAAQQNQAGWGANAGTQRRQEVLIDS